MSLISRVTVRVPASTSNLGPGFDCLGLALGLYNELTLELYPGPGGDLVEIEGEGASALPRDGRNLMVKAARQVLGRENRLHFKAVNRIPLARGLGSSAAAALAGLFAASRLFSPPAWTDDQVLEAAVALEGHPDNVTASALGGLVVSFSEGAALRTLALKPHKDLSAVVCIPEFQLSTAKARAVLPKKIPRADAVFNSSRALLLSSALERGLWERLGPAMEDRLHQPYRAKLVRGFSTVLRAARAAGPCGAALSGAGPTILALCRKGPGAQKIGRAMQRAWLRHGVESRALVLAPDMEGVRISQ